MENKSTAAETFELKQLPAPHTPSPSPGTAVGMLRCSRPVPPWTHCQGLPGTHGDLILSSWEEEEEIVMVCVHLPEVRWVHVHFQSSLLPLKLLIVSCEPKATEAGLWAKFYLLHVCRGFLTKTVISGARWLPVSVTIIVQMLLYIKCDLFSMIFLWFRNTKTIDNTSTKKTTLTF